MDDLPALHRLLPTFDVHEVHTVPLPADPERAIAAVAGTPVAADPVVRALLRMRGLRPRGTIAETFARMGFDELARGEGEIVFGASGAPWRPRGRLRSFGEAGPGTVRIAADFRADGRTLTTETRVAAVDDVARRSFGRYWRVVGPFSALVRRRWLAQIARDLR